MQQQEGDLVTPEWLRCHGLSIPYAQGIFESESAWVKVNAAGKIIGAGEKDTTLLGCLIRNDVLDELHAYYAMVLKDLRRYFLRQVAHRPNSIYATEFFSTSNSGILETLYLKVCRELGKETLAVVMNICEKPPRPSDAEALESEDTELRSKTRGRFRSECRPPLDALIRAIDDVRHEEAERKQREEGKR